MKTSHTHAKVSSFNLVFGIALLAFFLIALVPAIIKWVNSSNEIRDLDTASRMTESIQDYEDDIFKTTLDAYDVRDMIRNNLGSDVDFTPKSSGAAFFYDSSNHRIELRYYRDLSIYTAFHEHLNDSESNDQKCGSLTPEEIFGKGYYLLTDHGSLLPDVIRFLRDLASESRPLSDYEDTWKTLNETRPNLLNTYYSFGHGACEIDASRAVLRHFDPKHTLFVNNDHWLTHADTTEDLCHLLFAGNIRNIPEFNLNDSFDVFEDKITYDHIIIPKTVSNIEQRAFDKEAFDIDRMSIKSIDNLYVNHESLSGVETVQRSIRFFLTDHLINFSEHATFQTLDNDKIDVSFANASEMINQHGITRFETYQEEGILFVELYAGEFLVGYATNAYFLEYYLFINDPYPYYSVLLSDLRFDLANSPTIPKSSFVNWYDVEGNTDDQKYIKLVASFY